MDSCYILLSCVLLCCVFMVKAQRQPRIDLYYPNYLTPKEGETAKFICESTITPEAEIKWFRVPSGNRNLKYEITFPSTDYKKGDEQYPNTLVIEKAEPGKHDGDYTCSATNAINSTMLAYNLKLQVQYLNDEFLYKPRNTFFYDMDERRVAWANCKPPLSVPSIKPKWINGSSGLAVTPETDSRFQLREFSREGLFSQMILHNATIHDVGTWLCRYNHTLGLREATFQVMFYGNPTPPQNLHVKAMRLNGVIIEWDYLRNDLDFYDIEIIKTSTNEKIELKMSEHKSFVIQILEYEIRDLELGTAYKVRLRATSNLEQVGEWSDYLLFETVNDLAPVILLQPLTRNIGEDLEYNITCGVQANPPAVFTWYRNGVLIPETDNRYENNGLNLTILSPKHGDTESNAMYKCTATNKLGTVTSNEAKITVEWLEKDWQLQPSDYTFYHGQRFLRISARPPKGNNIRIQWFQNRKIIYDRTHPSYAITNYLDPNRVLHYAMDIKSLDRNAEGSYMCIASNKAGERTAYFFLVEKGFPTNIMTLRTYGVSSGALTLAWDPPVARQKVTDLGERYKYRTDLTYFNITYTNIQRDNDTHWYYGTPGIYTDRTFFTWKATITGLKVGDKYSYKIKSTDQAGQKSFWSLPFYYSIPENLPPYISSNPQSIEVEQGNAITIQCEVTADPPPTVVWYKDGGILQSANSKYDMAFSNTMYNLSIANIQRADYGQYHCTAENKNGLVTSEKATVDVIYFEDTFRYTKEVAPIYKTASFTELRILCIPPESNPIAKVLWSNSTHSFLPTTSDFVRDNRYLSQGISYFSILIKNPSNYVGTQVGCAAYNPRFGFNGNYKLAVTNITAYDKPELKKPITYEWKIGPTLILHWEKERPDFISYIVQVKRNISPFVILKTESTTETTIPITGLPSGIDFKVEVRVIDAGQQTSEPVTVIVTDHGATPVEITKDLGSIGGEYKEGRNGFLECDFSGEPTPHISWYKDGTNITITNGSFEVADNNRKLNLKNIDRNVHPGYYQCVANNEFYRNVKSALSQVLVNWIETEFEYGDTEKLFYDLDGYRKVSFSCAPPKSYPPIDRTLDNYIIWLKGETAFSKDGAVKQVIVDNGVTKDILEFDAVKADIGTYSCVYVHKAGVRRHNMTLNTYDGPLPPTNFKIEVTRLNIVIVTWTPPANENVDEFVIKYGLTDLSDTVKVAGTESRYEFQTLDELKVYKISLASKTDGKSSLALTDSFSTVKRPGLPSAVQNVAQEVITNTSATIKWDEPANLNGNSKITYFVKVCEGTTCNTYSDLEVRTLVLTPLKPATKYTYSITVRGDLPLDGPQVDGEFTTASNDGPPPVENFRLLSKKWNLIEIEWDHPLNNAKVHHYLLRVSGASWITIPKTETSFKVENLKEGKLYSLTIAAADVNSNTGVTATIGITTVDLMDPGQATNIESEPFQGFENSKVRLTWKKPSEEEDGNNVHLSYHIRYCSEFGCYNRTNIVKTFVEIGGLLSNTRYEYKLTTVRDDGKPGSSANGFFTTTKDIISKPSHPHARNTDTPTTSLYVSWGEPSILAGTSGENIEYKVQYCEDGTQNCIETKTSSRSMILRDLKPDTKYNIEVRAKHYNGVYGHPAVTSGKTTSDGGDSGGTSVGTIIGIVMAVFIVVLLLVTAALYYRKRRNRKMESEKEITEKGVKYNQGTVPRHQQQPTAYQNQQYRQPHQPAHMYQQRDPHRAPQAQYYHPQQPQPQQYRRPPSQQSRKDMYEMEMSRRR